MCVGGRFALSVHTHVFIRYTYSGQDAWRLRIVVNGPIKVTQGHVSRKSRAARMSQKRTRPDGRDAAA